MELRQLESLVAIADGGSFSRAAINLNLSQPSLSRQIAQLEQELGQRLLVRTGRGVELTSAGEVFIAHARDLLEKATRAKHAMRDLTDNPGGRVTVGLPPRVALGLSVPLIREFRNRFPRAVITVLEGLSLSLRESLVAGRMDLALGPPTIWNKLVLATPLARPGNRLIRETAQLLRELDFRKGLPGARWLPPPRASRIAVDLSARSIA